MDLDYKFDKNILNIVELSNEFSNDNELIENLIGDFINDLNSRMPLISEAISKKDYYFLSREAHKMKGCAFSIFANKLGQTFLNIELLAKKNDIAGIINLFNDLQNDFKILTYYFRIFDKLFD